jgi:hypothetical protein
MVRPMKSSDAKGQRVMGWCFVLLGLALVGLAVHFWLRGWAPGRGGVAIPAGSLRFVVIELALACVGVMGLVTGRQALRRSRQA